MILSELVTRIAALPPVATLIDSVRCAAAEPSHGDDTFIRVAPLVVAARAPLLAALAQQQTQPLLLLVASSEAAQRVAADLKQWLAPERVLLFPAHDTPAYDYSAPAAALRRQRLAVLCRLSAADQPPPVIVTPLLAVLQPTLTPQELAYATTEIRVNTWLSQDALLRRWLQLGYRSVPLVAEPGELARRGGLVDVWPAADEQPLRIEWFGDEIDSLRRFDAATQRTEQRLDSALVGPPYEVPCWKHQQAMERLAAVAVSSLRPEARDEWQTMLERLEAGDHADAWSMFAPFFREQGSQTEPDYSLCGHMPPGSVVLFGEALLLAHEAHDGHEQAEERRAALVSNGELPPDFLRPYMRWDELVTQMTALTLVDLSNNEELPAIDALLPATRSRQVAMQTETGEPLFVPAERFGGQLRRLTKDIVRRVQANEEVVAVTTQAARLQELVAEARTTDAAADRFVAIHNTLDEGWRIAADGLTLYTDSEIFGWQQRRSLAERQRRKARTANERAAFLRGLKPGDYVVHIEHGIARYEGMLRRTVGGIEREYLSLRYAGGDRLYVPVDQVDRVARYIGAGDNEPQLTRLGTQEWERAKRKARTAVRDLADELLAIYARRQSHTGHAFAADNEWQHELEDAFPYIETEDQLRALEAIKQDMEAPQPMDRLMCGDVGFGKTEVALRAAFKAVQDGKQVAVLVPTTVLAQQHYTTFSRRMAAFPLEVEMISRFRSTKEQNAILQRLAQGNIDILIGTHRLLSKDVRFKDLGLLIIDEEQRFGVRHKERLKRLRAEVDVLTLTATPIPRTLHMTLAGIRDMSLIDTPPEDRMPIKTYVVPYEDALIRDAIRRELDRGGQVYFVHNRVYSIYHVASHLRSLLPEAEIGVAHGQLDERDLEKTMLDFFGGRYDVLVCTTIIENGLDVPNTNTIIIDDATNYGLAQLYQLRGRVGRSANRAYAYLLYRQDRPMTEEAQQRLQAIQEATELGAGFRIAMRDLEIRGAGNLLGSEQSGHIAAVGFDLYSRLLEQAVTQLKAGKLPMPDAPDSDTPPDDETRPARAQVVVNEKVLVSPLVTLDLPLTAYLPTDYITDDAVRLGVYQQMAEAQQPDAVHELRQELRDRFGPVPEPAEHLLTWLHIKALSLAAGVSSIITTDEEFVIRLPVLRAQERAALERRFARQNGIKVGPQFVRLDRRVFHSGGSMAWIDALTRVLEALPTQATAPQKPPAQTSARGGG